jgi:hypothetical protein
LGDEARTSKVLAEILYEIGFGKSNQHGRRASRILTHLACRGGPNEVSRGLSTLLSPRGRSEFNGARDATSLPLLSRPARTSWWATTALSHLIHAPTGACLRRASWAR